MLGRGDSHGFPRITQLTEGYAAQHEFEVSVPQGYSDWEVVSQAYHSYWEGATENGHWIQASSGEKNGAFLLVAWPVSFTAPRYSYGKQTGLAKSSSGFIISADWRGNGIMALYEGGVFSALTRIER